MFCWGIIEWKRLCMFRNSYPLFFLFYKIYKHWKYFMNIWRLNFKFFFIPSFLWKFYFSRAFPTSLCVSSITLCHKIKRFTFSISLYNTKTELKLENTKKYPQKEKFSRGQKFFLTPETKKKITQSICWIFNSILLGKNWHSFLFANREFGMIFRWNFPEFSGRMSHTIWWILSWNEEIGDDLSSFSKFPK